MDKNKQIQAAKDIKKSSLSKFLDIDVDELLVVKKKNCKLCNSKHREEAEAEFERTGKYDSAYHLLTGKGETLSRVAVRNHLYHHFLPALKKQKIQVYAEDLPEFLGSKQDRRVQLRERIWMMQKLMYEIGMDADNASADDKRKSADAVKKLSDTVTMLEDKISEMDQKLEPIEVLIEKIAASFSIHMKQTTSQDTKKVLMTLLDEIMAGAETIFVDDRQQQ